MIHRPSRVRRIAKWTGVVVCVLSAVGWGVSLRWAVSWTVLRPDGTALRVGLDRGGVFCANVSPREFTKKHSSGRIIVEPGFRSDRYPLGVGPVWLPKRSKLPGMSGLSCPIWMLVLPAALPTAFLLYRDRRYPPGHCQGCGYDLTGNESGVCPECGRAV